MGGPPAKPAHDRRADLVLLLVTAAWGLTFPAIKGAVHDAPALTFLVLRFPLAAFGLLLVMRGRLFAGWRGRVRQGIVLGLVSIVSYAFQVIGLRTTTASRSAFITGLSVVIVPLLYAPIRRRPPGLMPTIGAALSFAGLLLLTRPDRGGLNPGDVLTLGCAVAYAFYVLLIESFSARASSEPLIGLQAVTMAVASLPALLLPGGLDVRWTGGLVTGLAVTVPVAMFTVVALTRFQPRTTATRAAVIYTAEPVFALVFSALWLGERLDGTGLAGAALIVCGVLLAVVR